MDRVMALVILFHLILWVSGELIPGNVTVHIWEGNVTVTWDSPPKIPGGFLYQVQLSNTDSPSVWVNVSQCNLLKATVCNIGCLSSKSMFKVRVGVLTNQYNFSWSTTRYNNIRSSQLYAPTFSLSSTSYSVHIKVHRKQMLDKLFPYGVQYIAYLWPEGQENKTLTKSYDDIDDDSEMKFNSLQSLQVYCVHVKVESIATEVNNISLVQCIKLPLDSVMDYTLVICTVFLGLLGIMALLILLICFLKYPREMPAALKPVMNGWYPLIIGSVQVETVTDKGWILTNQKGETKMETSKENKAFTEKDIERRQSLDSGVSMEQTIRNTVMDEQMVDLLMDSGCESLKGTEECESVGRVTGQPSSLIGIRRGEGSSGKDDSGLGLGHHEISDSLEKEDNGLPEAVVENGYRSQSSSTVEVEIETTNSCGIDTNMAATSCGYRSSHIKCLCSTQEYCIWCKSTKSLSENCQPQTTALTEFSQLMYQANDGNTVISNYLKKRLDQRVDNLIMETTESVVSQSDLNFIENSLLLFSCPLLLQNKKKQASTMNIRSFTLDDVELKIS